MVMYCTFRICYISWYGKIWWTVRYGKVWQTVPKISFTLEHHLWYAISVANNFSFESFSSSFFTFIFWLGRHLVSQEKRRAMFLKRSKSERHINLDDWVSQTNLSRLGTPEPAGAQKRRRKKNVTDAGLFCLNCAQRPPGRINMQGAKRSRSTTQKKFGFYSRPLIIH